MVLFRVKCRGTSELPDQYLVAALICLFGGGLFSLAEGALRGLSGKRLENLLRSKSVRGGRFTSFFYHKTEIILTARLIAFTGLLAWIAVVIWEYLGRDESSTASARPISGAKRSPKNRRNPISQQKAIPVRNAGMAFAALYSRRQAGNTTFISHHIISVRTKPY